MTTHTPGPWVLDGHNMSSIIRCTVLRGHPDAKHTCGDYETIADCKGDNWKANARLISAAPDMLDALEQCAEYFDKFADADHDQDGFVPNEAMQMLTLVMNAIAKAEGRT